MGLLSALIADNTKVRILFETSEEKSKYFRIFFCGGTLSLSWTHAPCYAHSFGPLGHFPNLGEEFLPSNLEGEFSPSLGELPCVQRVRRVMWKQRR